MNNGDLLLRLEILSEPSLLCVVRAAMERLTEAIGFPAAECRSITRAVDEALTNIMRHSYGGRADQPIGMVCRKLPRKGGVGLEIVLTDVGPAVDPAKLRGRRLDDIKPGGLGLHFIRQSMDSVEFKRARGTNELRLIKYQQEAPTSCVS